MSKVKWAAILATTLLIALGAVFAGCLVIPSSPMSVIVPDDFPTIQAAIGNCTPGSTIHIRNGIYNELLVVDKSLTLIGENRQNTIIKGNYTFDKSNASITYTFYTTANITANNIVISNLNICGSDYGVDITGNNCQLIDNNIQAFDSGIINLGSNQDFTGNNITGNKSQWGMLCWGNNILVSRNIFDNYMCCIMNSANNITIEKNIFANCQLKRENDYSSGVRLYICQNCNIYGNVFEHLNAGIIYESASNTSVYNNTLAHNLAGVRLANYSFWNSTPGSNNLFFDNIFTDNQKQVVIITTRLGMSNRPNGTDTVTWDNGTIGNYWSDYQTKYPDATQNSNETYDTPYVIDANNKDNHPLIFK